MSSNGHPTPQEDTYAYSPATIASYQALAIAASLLSGIASVVLGFIVAVRSSHPLENLAALCSLVSIFTFYLVLILGRARNLAIRSRR